MQGIDSCIEFSKVLSASKIKDHLIPFILKFAKDKSWRIRYLMAEKLKDLSDGIGSELAKEHLVPYYCLYLEDSESEVRTAAVKRLPDIGHLLDKKMIVEQIAPSLKKLSTDHYTYVR